MTEEKLKIGKELTDKLDLLNKELKILNDEEIGTVIGYKIYHNNHNSFKGLREHVKKSIETLIRADLQSRISLLTEQFNAL